MPDTITGPEGHEAAESPGRRLLGRGLGVMAVLAWFLVVHNYGISLLPEHRQILSPSLMQPEPGMSSFAYTYPFAESVPDRPRDMRSRLVLREEGWAYGARLADPVEIRLVGGDRFAHLANRIVFATSDNSDPRINGRVYAVSWPWLYSGAVGRSSVLGLLLATGGLAWLGRRPIAAGPRPPVPAGRWMWAAALLLFLAGLYANTGTRAPYAITSGSLHTDPASGFVYNQDHPHFRVLFDFVDAQPKTVWDGALLLRRVLYPVLCWPAMKLLGFETGGVVMNLLFSVIAFLGTAWWLEKRIGARGAALGVWLLAAYPGFAYWVGMPYPYAVIAPGSLLLAIAMHEIMISPGIRATLGWSLLMGGLYLAYDFAPVFLPATLGMLLWRRRWLAAGTVLLTGMLPLLAWLVLLRTVFGQTLGNSNSGVYQAVLDTLLSQQGWLALGARLPLLGDQLLAIFFGANFIFLPATFLGVLVLNVWSSRVRWADSEIALLGGIVLLFLVINLGADYAGAWNMSGTWAARMYQQMFPLMIFFCARWWQALPVRSWYARWLLIGGLGLVTAGNLLVSFGPIMQNPGGVSGEAFYRFYAHADGTHTSSYEHNLRTLRRRILGLGPVQPAIQP